jgi:hypothetical protein
MKKVQPSHEGSGLDMGMPTDDKYNNYGTLGTSGS